MSNIEIWKDIKGYEGLYQVSNLGMVKSLNYRHTGKEKVLKGRGDKYPFITLHKDGAKTLCYIHILVAEAFIPNPQGLPEVNHKDENKHNNEVSNLEWCDRKYNMDYGTRKERAAEARSIPILQYTLDGQLVKEWASAKEARVETGINQSNIVKCLKNKQKSCGGYKWVYK